MKKSPFFLLALVVGSMWSQEKETLSNAHYVNLVLAIRQKIFLLSESLNAADTNGHIYLQPYDLFCADQKQTVRGIFLEYEYGVPRALHFPLGRWQMVNQSSIQKKHDQKLLEKIIETFKAELREKTPRVKGSRGSSCILGATVDVYELKEVDGVALEKAEYKQQTEYMEYKHATALWKALTQSPH